MILYCKIILLLRRTKTYKLNYYQHKIHYEF